MKLISKLLCLSALLCTFASCDKEYELPPLQEPTYTLPANAQTITIEALRTKYNEATQEHAITIADSLWLKARVIANDRSGNVFKQIFIQDETGGISFLVDQSSVYNDYPVGQEVYINLKGLCISVYGDEKQIGYPDGHLFRTPYEIFKKHVFKTGWANKDNVIIQDFDNFEGLNKAPEKVLFNLVRLKNVHFEQGGKTNFAEKTNMGERTLVDDKGNTIVVRTSNYADFAANTLPEGVGTVVAILGRFRGTWQLTIPTADDLYGFVASKTEKPVVVEPTKPTVPGVLFSETFKDGQGSFTIDNKSMDSKLSFVWKFDSRYGMKASAFVKPNNYAAESWLVSPEINLTTAKAATLTFEHAGNFFNNIQEEATLLVKGNDNTWKPITIPTYPVDWTFVTASVDLSAYAGQTIQIAFCYKSTAEKAGTWEIKNVTIK